MERGLTVREPEKEGKPPTLRTYRTLRYTRLSDNADVEAYADPAKGNVQVALVGKYMGRPWNRRQTNGLPSNPSTTRDGNGDSLLRVDTPGSGPASKRKR